MKYEIHSDIVWPTLLGVKPTHAEAQVRAGEIEKEWRFKAAQNGLVNYYFYPLRIKEVP